MSKRSTIARPTFGVLAVGALVLTGCASPTADNEPVESPSADSPAASSAPDCSSLAGSTIELVIPYNAGGGYDILARVIIPGLENALDATVLPINKPGAGGLLAINELVAASADGTQIAILNGTGAASAILAGAEGPTFGFDDLSYIGRVAVDDLVVTTNASGEYQSWDDVLESDGFRFGSTGRGSSDYIVANALIEAFDLENAEVIVGFESQAETDLALIQGNVDAIAGPLDSRRASILSGETTAVLSFADVAPEDAGDAAVFSDLDLSNRATEIIDGIKLITAFGRPLVAPAGVDDETLTCLQNALAAAVEDPEVLEQAEQTQRELAFVSGDDMVSDIIPGFGVLSEDVLEVLRSSY